MAEPDPPPHVHGTGGLSFRARGLQALAIGDARRLLLPVSAERDGAPRREASARTRFGAESGPRRDRIASWQPHVTAFRSGAGA